MGYFSNLALEIEEAFCQGATVDQLAKRFDLSREDVREFIDQLDECDRDSAELG
jgi:uncharacterized protein (DUF433 family)